MPAADQTGRVVNGALAPPPQPPTLIVDCGINYTNSALPECAAAGTNCTATAASAAPGVVVTTLVTYTLENGVMV